MYSPCAAFSNKKNTPFNFFKMRKIAKIACQVSVQYTASIKANAKRHEKQKI